MGETDLPATALLGPARGIAAALLTGFSCMAAELTAVRLLAPHFGDSAYVWTNVIGVILAAMALGAALGGRLAGRDDAASWPLRLLLLAGGFLLVAPFLAGWIGDWLLPDDLPLDAAMQALIRGSLVAAALVFAPALLLLSAVSPLLIVLLARSGATLGRAAGDIAAAGTVGSLVGTFAATHWLVPGFGCRIALTIAAGALLVAAALVAPAARRRAVAAVLLLPFAAAALHGGPLRPPPPGRELLAERETPYQFLQVLRERPPGEAARTLLVINEGLDSFHSLAVAGSAFTAGAYYDWHAIAPLLAGDGNRPDGLCAASIGDAAGTLRAVYAAVHPGARVDAVDIDAATMALGDEFFPGPKATGERHAVDGRVFLAHAVQRWHVIHVDAYAHQVYVPAHLASREFFTAAHAHLHDGGVIACNVGALDLDDPVLRAIGTTLASVFGNATALLVPDSRNALLIARRGRPATPARLREFAFGGESPAIAAADRARWRAIVDAASAREAWRDVGTGGPVLRDDRPELDELLFAGYVQHGDPRQRIECRGARAVATAELEAYQALQRDDWPGVLAAVEGSERASPFLRLLAGDARWRLRELRSATLEYQDGLALGPTAEQRGQLEDRLARAATSLAPIETADAAARRNAWLAWAVVAVGVALAFVLRPR